MPVVTETALIVASLAAAPALFARGPQFTSGVNLVEVYATVTDEGGNPVTTLTKDDFTVLEDGDLQTVSTFAIGDVPLALAVALDRSFSMKSGGRLEAAKSAIATFVNTLRSGDRVMLLAIGSDVEEAAPLSSDRATLIAALSSLDEWGTTSLHDAIIAGIDRIQPQTGRRALVILSDGNDRYSRTTAGETLARARSADVLLYPIALGGARPPLFAELAVATGGRSMHVKDMRTLTPTLASIGRELRSQYLLGYTPSRPIASGEDRWRTITVTLSRPGLRVRARDGYKASGGGPLAAGSQLPGVTRQAAWRQRD